MISANKLLKLARKWQKLAAIKRKRITLPHAIGITNTSNCSTSPVSEKGHFAVYSADKKGFLLPLEYLRNEIIKQLFNMAEEEFGLQNKGPLTLPCDTEHMGYAFGLIKQQATRDVENAFLTSITSHCFSLSFCLQDQVTSNQLPICSF
ncbi:auxin-responsive protein SAUR68-like [Hevea brasiliensis]|uniref:auxin-responsive protein SAUR68-like n=1 Tax=Hevea brasiliensis TaxID=3981 RepID=UPI0025DF674E|nr:auxin-responsive protein SAUR68-like [Hevea brasiliensis]